MDFQVVAVEDRLDSEDLVSESCVREPLVLFSLRRLILKRFPYFLSVFSLSLAKRPTKSSHSPSKSVILR